jgi:hypothetical protein
MNISKYILKLEEKGEILSTMTLLLPIEFDEFIGSKKVTIIHSRSTMDKDGKRITKTMYGRRYKATKCIYDIITEWLTDNKDNDEFSQSSLGYFGSLDGVLRDLINYGDKEELRVPRLDDYPDYRKVQECINDNFSSYF